LRSWRTAWRKNCMLICHVLLDQAGNWGEAKAEEVVDPSHVTNILIVSAVKSYWHMLSGTLLLLFNPTSDLVRQYDFPVLLLCLKMSDMVFVAFVSPLSEPVRRFSSCSTDFSQQIAQVVLSVFPCFSLLKL
jgi:hypothetical protein